MSQFSETFKLTPKYRGWFKNTIKSRFNVLEGAVRSGKDYISALAFIECIRACKSNTDNLIGAVSTSLGMNIVGKYICNYLNIDKIGKDNNLDCIVFRSGRYTHKIYFAGGAKINSQDSIQGLTLQNIYLTECNLLHETFIEQCFARIAASDNPKIFFTLNPLHENHWFYNKFLDVWDRQQQEEPTSNMLNYRLAMIMDNPIMNEEKYNAFVKGLDPASVFYKRNVLGLRVAGQGQFFNFTDENMFDIIEPSEYREYIVVFDAGVTISATSGITMGLHFNQSTKEKDLHIMKEYYHLNGSVDNPSFKSDDQYCEEIVAYIKNQMDIYKKAPSRVYVDANTVFRKKLETAMRKGGIGQLDIKFPIKDSLEDRGVDAQNLIYSNNIKVHSSCKNMITEMRSAEYDDKKFDTSGRMIVKKAYDEQGHGDLLDTAFYGISYYMKQDRWK